MTAPGRQVWFERSVLPAMVAQVNAQVEVLGPGDLTPDDPHRMLGEARGIVAGIDIYDAAVMDRAPHLRVISRTGIGYDRVDLSAATARGVAVCNAPDAPTVSTAEHTLALIFAAAKNVKRSEQRLREGETNLYARHEAMELEGKTLGLAGFGRIARSVARMAQGCGMRVIAFDPFLPAAEFPEAVRPMPSLAATLGAADIVSVHVPLTADTQGTFNEAAFAAMKPGSVFVNTARGGLVNQDALLAALDSGHLLAAGLDVTDPEPLPRGHPLLHRDDVVVTPHVASGTADGKIRLFRAAFEQVVQVLDGERPRNLVNPEVWDRVATAQE